MQIGSHVQIRYQVQTSPHLKLRPVNYVVTHEQWLNADADHLKDSLVFVSADFPVPEVLLHDEPFYQSLFSVLFLPAKRKQCYRKYSSVDREHSSGKPLQGRALLVPDS